MSKVNFEEEMEYLHSLSQFMPSKVVSGEIELGLDAIRELLTRLGNPERDLNIIHVAGTNGKGSTIAFLSSILKESGYRTGVYTSPVLIRFTEQIRIFEKSTSIQTFNQYAEKPDEKSDKQPYQNTNNTSEITEAELADIIESARPHIESMKAEGHKLPSEFEVITALALLYFKQKNCDFVILECGLGGRTDATNVIETSLLSVITAIGLDHTEILGDTLQAIAGEKAGIIKENGNAVVLDQADSVVDVFATACRDRNANLHIAKPGINPRISGTDGQYFDYEDMDNLFIPMLGRYQITNASIAVKAALVLDKLGYSISEDAIREGLANAIWPCRFEIVHKNPLVVIDGCHNTDGVRALLRSFDELWPDKKIVFIAGVLRDKSYGEMFRDVAEHAERFFTVTPPSKRALPADELRDFLNENFADKIGPSSTDEDYECETNKSENNNFATSYDSIDDAVRAALNESSEDDIICAFGSLYYVGMVRECFIK